MAVSKALVKSATLRLGLVEPGALMSAANAEVSRDNPELLFVTAFAAIIDLETGGIVYCNAGHANPFRVDPVGAAAGRLGGGDGPPLCAVDDFAYRGARAQLKAGELVCIVTDGVTEARSPATRSTAPRGSRRCCRRGPSPPTRRARSSMHSSPT